MTAEVVERVHTGTLHVMDRTGDSRFTWSSDSPDEVKAARKQFKHLKKQGYLAYKVDPSDGSQGEVISEFDETAEALIMSPQLVGG